MGNSCGASRAWALHFCGPNNLIQVGSVKSAVTPKR
jgi:hypothetical protein